MTFDDQFNHINKQKYFTLTIVLDCFFFAEECWTSPVFFCTDVIYSSSVWGLFMTLFGVKVF